MDVDAARLLLGGGLVSQSDLSRARGVQQSSGGSLPAACRALGLLDEGAWVQVLARSLSLPTVDLEQVDVDPAARGKADESLLQKLWAFPFQLREGGLRLVVGLAEPQDLALRAQLKSATGCELRVAVATYRQVEQALERHPNPRVPSGVTSFLAAGRLEAEAAEADAAAQAQAEGFVEIETFEGDILEAMGVALGVEVKLGELSEADRILLQALQENEVASSRALRAALELCLESKLFTGPELRAKLQEAEKRRRPGS